MKLDRTTYEAWLLDRIEGRLTAAQERELTAFLALHPELDPEAHELPSITPSSEARFEEKDALRKELPPTGMPDPARLNEFLVALQEGDLRPDQRTALAHYLQAHPEAAKDARLFALTRSAAEPIPYADRNDLRRAFPPRGLPDRHRLMDFLIAAMEGDLDAAHSEALAAWIAVHPEARRDERLLALARIQAVPVVFPHKEALKKRERVAAPQGRVVPLWTRYAAAASVALLAGIAWWMLRDRSTVPEQHIAQEQALPKQQPPKPAGALPGTQPAQATEEQAHTTGPQQRSSAPQAHEQDLPQQRVPAPQQRPGSMPVPQDMPRPNTPPPDPTGLAQQPAMPADTAAPLAPGQGQQPLLADAGPVHADPSVARFITNTVRADLLGTEQRDASLDGHDAVAAVDKGLHVITGGAGGLQVERGASRDRFRLRLGRNLTISASRGR